ncbi:alpha/beta-hydrolase [Periconia macrospinosa]|uniref:Carboxylic ester hydrolase n=1 Tax=Periconia macrospinosa TaxID=97972 RepID=A0A2V1D552_9PLEO|nr:alpha/beta-hydrolase [Periconia macrospinosa]
MNLLLLNTLLVTVVGVAPSARIKDGLIQGFTSNGVDNFFGIPYAEPPVGNLRLRRAQPLSKPLGTFYANSTPRACPQKSITGDLPILATWPEQVQYIYAGYNTSLPYVSEDCLTVNIQRPANTTADAKLPVVFWIYGGAWEQGGTARYDYTNLIKKSVEEGGVIVVSANYRVGSFGFLGGKELKAEGNTNLGLRDQRLSLEWVQDNIAAFGGNAEKVTIWGESAGSSSVYHHLLINGGDNKSNRTGKPLFRAGILNSGSSFPAEPIDSPTAQSLYDRIVSAVGCASTSPSYSSLECLRKAPYQKIADATNALPHLFSPEGFHINYVPRPDDSDTFFTTSQLLKGHGIADVPLIVGHQEDETTVFMAPTTEISSPAKLVTMLQALYPNAPRAIIEKFVSYYHGDAATGAPFRTNASEEVYPNSKMNAAVTTDLLFVFQARAFLSSITTTSPHHSQHKSPVYAFQATYNHGFPILGTFHGSDLVLIAQGTTGVSELPFQNVAGRYVRFVRDAKFSGEEWPVYEGVKKEVLRFNVDGMEVFRDDSRSEAFGYFESVKGVLRL